MRVVECVRACEVTEVWTGRGRFANRPYGVRASYSGGASPEACREQEAFSPLRVDGVDDVGDGLGCEAES